MVFRPKKNEANTGSCARGKYRLFPGEHLYLLFKEEKELNERFTRE
jgi:hypothetical protein